MRIFFSYIFVFWQRMMPKHWLSRLGGKIADSPHPYVKSTLCRWAIRSFQIDLSQAISSQIEDYSSFNDFFHRRLAKKVRQVCMKKDTLVSPVDGKLSQHGFIQHGKLIQAKGVDYSLSDLTNYQSSIDYQDGYFSTFYLSPTDYHRVHCPIDCELIHSEYIPGRLFAVNEHSVRLIPQLFAKNERLVCHLQSEIGRVILVFVGALLVNGIRVKWLPGKPEKGAHPLSQQWFFSKGSELGFFRFGSTVILITPPKKINQFLPKNEQNLLMGQRLATINLTE